MRKPNADKRAGDRHTPSIWSCLAVGHRILRVAHGLLSSHRPYDGGGPDDCRPTDKGRL